jgi:hypothetical protein
MPDGKLDFLPFGTVTTFSIFNLSPHCIFCVRPFINELCPESGYTYELIAATKYLNEYFNPDFIRI